MFVVKILLIGLMAYDVSSNKRINRNHFLFYALISFLIVHSCAKNQEKYTFKESEKLTKLMKFIREYPSPTIVGDATVYGDMESDKITVTDNFECDNNVYANAHVLVKKNTHTKDIRTKHMWTWGYKPRRDGQRLQISTDRLLYAPKIVKHGGWGGGNVYFQYERDKGYCEGKIDWNHTGHYRLYKVRADSGGDFRAYYKGEHGT